MPYPLAGQHIETITLIHGTLSLFSRVGDNQTVVKEVANKRGGGVREDASEPKLSSAAKRGARWRLILAETHSSTTQKDQPTVPSERQSRVEPPISSRPLRREARAASISNKMDNGRRSKHFSRQKVSELRLLIQVGVLKNECDDPSNVHGHSI